MGSSLNSVLVAATLLERTPPAPLSPSSKWKPELTKDIDNLDASVNIRAGKAGFPKILVIDLYLSLAPSE